MEWWQVSTVVFVNWAWKIVDEMEDLRCGFQYMWLVMYYCTADLWYRNLNYLEYNNIIVIVIPSHISHILQSLDVSVFSSFKCTVRR